MPFFEMLPGGMPAGLQSDMNAVLNKKFGTVLQDYVPETWPDTVNLMGPLEEKTVSGSVVAFSDGADDVPLKSCAVTIAPTLDSVSSVDVVSAGKNLAEECFMYSVTNYVVNPVYLKAGAYTISFESALTSTIHIRKGDTINLSGQTYATKYNSNFFAFTADEDGYYYFQFYKSSEWGDTPPHNAQLEVGSTVTTYTPYVTPTTHTANLGRTIYGGTADVVNGTGTETYGLQTFDGTETWTLLGTTFWYTSKPKENVKASHSCTTSNGVVIRYSTNGQIRCYISDNPNVVDTSTNMNTLLSNGVSFNYQLNDNVDFTFTPVPINSRLGNNTMWGDGDLSVIYRSMGTVYQYTEGEEVYF